MSLLRHWGKKAKQNEAAKNDNTPSCASKEYTKEPESKKCNNFQNKSSRKFLSITFIYNFSFRVSICLQLRFFKFFCILLTVSIYFYFRVAFPTIEETGLRALEHAELFKLLQKLQIPVTVARHIRNIPQFKDTE